MHGDYGLQMWLRHAQCINSIAYCMHQQRAYSDVSACLHASVRVPP